MKSDRHPFAERRTKNFVNVRSRRSNGRHLLGMSISHFDPQQTFGHCTFGRVRRVTSRAGLPRHYAARTDPRKLLTSIFSCSDCDDNPVEASNNFDAARSATFAAWVTPRMFSFTLPVHVAACWMLPE